jgi:hypothetical protein
MIGRARTNGRGRHTAGRVPLVLLTDTVQVQPYRDVDTWDPAYPLRCLLDEAPSSGRQGRDTVTDTTIRLFCLLGSDVPTGSKVTLADGRSGSIQAVAERGPTTVFPVPAHLEAQIRVGGNAPTPIGGVTVTVLRRVVTGRDAYGNDVYGETPVKVRGVTLGQLDQSATSTATGDSRVTRSRTVVFPPGTKVKAIDRLLIGGARWSIDGEPTVITEPVLGVTAGVVVRAVHTTG